MSRFQRNRSTSPFNGKQAATAKVDSSQQSPVFSFEYMKGGTGYSVPCCDDTHKASLVGKLFILSQMTWLQIQQAPRHGLGSEKISRDNIKPELPLIVTEEVQLLALRYHGKNPMVGFRDGRTFNILFLDKTMDVYPHGS